MIWRVLCKPKDLNFSEAGLLSLSDGNSQVLCTIIEEKWIPGLQASTQSRKTCPKSTGMPSSGHFLNIPPRAPAPLTFQEHPRALPKLPVHSHHLLTGTSMSMSCSTCSREQLELCSLLAPVMQAGSQAYNFWLRNAPLHFFLFFFLNRAWPWGLQG